jgi:SAM-dependent methyltransferase
VPEDEELRGYDLELHRLDAVFRQRWGIEAHDHVLDVGCGAGLTTRRAAQAARDGTALGVDVSPAAIEQARAAANGIPNVSFEVADAQTHAFERERYDVAISRFGTMFFSDPVAAFANVNTALRRRGRLVMLVWQPADQNEWDAVIHRSLTGDEGAGATALPGLDPFSLGDPAITVEILERAGFDDVGFADVREPVLYGRDVEAALDFVRGFSCTRELLKGANATEALARLRAALEAHQRADGVWFDSAAWLITARKG